jgi:cytochrome c551/c552/glucose/arabinose dehydrogenase
MDPNRTAPIGWLCRLVGLLLAWSVLHVRGVAGLVDDEPEALRPGLAAAYRSRVDEGATLHRIESKPALTLGHSSPHPRLPAGPFEVSWEGLIRLRDAGPIAFHASVGGEVHAEVDGVVVLDGRGATDTGRVGPATTLEREPGDYPLTIRYRSLAGVPARLQVSWEGPSFAREPLPAWRLGHRDEGLSPAARRGELAERGRAAALRLGCARCHAGAFPGVDDPPPGPSLADAGRRLRRAWLLRWLDDPAGVRPGARMPALFPLDRRGFVERWLIAGLLARPGDDEPDNKSTAGDHRAGRREFVGLGCAACHLVPDVDAAPSDDPGRTPLDGLTDRFGADDLAAFLANPHARYPDGRMPRLPLTPDAARDVAAYLRLWSKPAAPLAAAEAPTDAEVRDLARRLGVPAREAGEALLREKGCVACHAGLGPSLPRDVPIKRTDGGCLADRPGSGPRYPALDDRTREALAAFLEVAPAESHASPVASRRRQLERAGCVRCHQRDSDRPPPIEAVGATLGGAFLQVVPFERTPRLNDPLQKFTRRHLVAAVREGVAGLRPAEYTYRMPAYGAEAETLVQALAEADGELPDGDDPPSPPAADPTLGTLHGPALVGSRGYSCISCHVWGGRQLSRPDPGAVGPDLTRVVGRIRRDWFDRYLEDPSRSHPGTPMPAIFPRGRPATLGSVLDGDPSRQKDALWAYFAAGTAAPAPEPPPPLPIAAPAAGAPPLVAQVPIHMPAAGVVEAIVLLTPTHDLVVYDLASHAPRHVLTGARILRTVEGRIRAFLASGTPFGDGLAADRPWQLVARGMPREPVARELHGYDRLADGVRIRWRARFGPEAVVEVEETLRVVRDGAGGRLVRDLRLTGVPAGGAVALRCRTTEPQASRVTASIGSADSRRSGRDLTATLTPDGAGVVVATVSHGLPLAQPAPTWEGRASTDPDRIEGARERPGYRAIAYPRPKTVSGEDRIMPAALAVHPKDGRVFVASLKTGELFVLRDPTGDGRSARFDDYAGGLFQDALSMLAEDDALYVLHRRNLTRVSETDGSAVRFDRVAALPHGVSETYDYAYGLVRDKTGGFVISYAPYANTSLPGSGGAVRLEPGRAPAELAFGFRNPLGWCTGPEGEVFFTDNQGEWVAANKLCHLEEGRFYGFPNPAQKEHASRAPGRAAVWVPYGWARSINGVAYDRTGGKFGPFAGQFFLAELMFGGALIRADLERVNGRYQGACFPFWGPGLLGPVALAFGPGGGLYVGGITEPGWMAQPDRGALFRIDYTGAMPFEMRTIRVRPRGFRIHFTAPVDRATAADPASYRLEHYRYESTGAYGSPELDRTRVDVELAAVAADGLSVDLDTRGLVAGRVYLVGAAGVRSASGEPLVHGTGAYTLHEIPAGGD